jgi:hypothetical protein
MLKPVLQVDLFELELVGGGRQKAVKQMALGATYDPVLYEGIRCGEGPPRLHYRQVKRLRYRIRLYFVAQGTYLALNLLYALVLGS